MLLTVLLIYGLVSVCTFYLLTGTCQSCLKGGEGDDVSWCFRYSHVYQKMRGVHWYADVISIYSAKARKGGRTKAGIIKEQAVGRIFLPHPTLTHAWKGRWSLVWQWHEMAPILLSRGGEWIFLKALISNYRVPPSLLSRKGRTESHQHSRHNESHFENL